MTILVRQLVLASTSIFRKQVLENHGIKVLIRAPDADEGLVKDENPRVRAAGRALLKAQAISGLDVASLVIGADQTLSCDGRLLTKAQTVEEAQQNLEFLAGKQHFLHSAIALVLVQPGGDRAVAALEVVDICMHMRRLTREQIAAYVATNEWCGCVGSYRYEERGGLLFERADGDLSAILGMPIPSLVAACNRLGVDLVSLPEGPWAVKSSFEGQ